MITPQDREAMINIFNTSFPKKEKAMEVYIEKYGKAACIEVFSEWQYKFRIIKKNEVSKKCRLRKLEQERQKNGSNNKAN